MSKDKRTKVTISEEAVNDESKAQELSFQGQKNQESKHQR